MQRQPLTFPEERKITVALHLINNQILSLNRDAHWLGDGKM
jgi:hypothetical protein